MKNMKKLTAFVLALLLIFGMTTPAYATGSPENSKVLAGHETTVEFRFKNISAIRGWFSYSNSEMFSNVEMSISGLTSGTYNPEKGALAYYHSSAVDEVVITLKLTVASGVAVNDSCVITLKYESTSDGYLPSEPEYFYDTVTVTVYAIDYTELNNQIAAAEGLSEKQYTSDTWSALQSELTLAKNALTAEDQAVVDLAAKNLELAIKNLKLVDYSELNVQISRTEGLEQKNYTADSWAKMQSALTVAKNALNTNVQADIDKAATDLKNAIDALVAMNYSALEQQIQNAEKLDSSKYTIQSWANLLDALNAAKKALNSNDQNVVDTAEKNLKNAISNLVNMDYSALQQQIKLAESLNSADYTAQSWAKLVTALDAAKKALTSNTQSVVDEATNALKNAIAELAPSVPAVDYSALKKQIGIAKDLNASEYTASTWANLQTALRAAEAALSSSSQSEVDLAAARLKTAIQELVKVVVPTVDYSELNRQIANAEGLKKADYTADSWAKLESALNAAKAALGSKTQSEVDSAASNLKSAIDNLVKIVIVPIDYSELNRQITVAQGLTAKDYTSESWKKLADALQKAQEATSSKSQSEVDAAAQNLSKAINDLVSMDYSALISAVGAANKLSESEKLNDLWLKLHAQLTLADQLLTSGDQSAVDQCAAEISRLIGEIIAEYEKLNNKEPVIVEIKVPTLPEDPFCNIGNHRVWPVLFWISFSLNLVAIALVVAFLVLKKKKRSDDTPLVDYDIEDDTK